MFTVTKNEEVVYEGESFEVALEVFNEQCEKSSNVSLSDDDGEMYSC